MVKGPHGDSRIRNSFLYQLGFAFAFGQVTCLNLLASG